MTRQELEEALTELHLLLECTEHSEDALQAWFERHPAALLAYGYRRGIPHPRLESATGEVFVPDFLVEDLTGVWSVLELKRPDTPVVKKVARRKSFYAEFESYISQCREYSSFFADRAQRLGFNAKHNTSVQEMVPAVVVAGRRQDVDFVAVQKLLFDRGAKVSLQTWDDVATRLEFFRAQQFAINEERPGLSIHVVAVLGKQVGQEYFLLDYGTELHRNRVSVFVSPEDEVCFRVLDTRGTSYVARVPFEDAPIFYGIPVYLAFELGFAEDYTYLSVEINGHHFADRRVDKMVVEPESLEWQVMGSDVEGRTPAEFSMVEVVVVGKTLTFSDKAKMREYLMWEHYDAMGGSGRLPSRVTFSGKQSLHTVGHPNFEDGDAAQQGDGD